VTTSQKGGGRRRGRPGPRRNGLGNGIADAGAAPAGSWFAGVSPDCIDWFITRARTRQEVLALLEEAKQLKLAGWNVTALQEGHGDILAFGMRYKDEP
jgi:hypothetical protein